jgi:hypothetical protein
MVLAKFKSDPGNGANSPTDLKAYKFDLNDKIGRITGAYIESLSVTHFITFGIGTDFKAIMFRIDFGNGSLTF